MLYSKEHANANECVVCGVSRWKSSDDHSTDEFTNSTKKKKIPIKTFFMLSLLIPGPTAPGNDIDIYLQPLIDELNDLWDIGVGVLKGNLPVLFVIRIVLQFDYKTDENAVTWVIVDFCQLIIDFDVIKSPLMEMKGIEQHLNNCLGKMFYIN
ncbi:hypothetical protein CK203_064295 [Vitis vinifera]|uniref:Uncharacterized protein n=1 Tax=Vitis vinifera TaxID=29760 RepID=A0A438G9L9_VITVI|nr:hypothetical protein CK203_064295 [Vitis vinifera]